MTRDRLLLARGAHERTYELRRVGAAGASPDGVVFVTDSVNGNTPDETAEANLADWSDHNEGAWELSRYGLDGRTVLARAEHGCVWRKIEKEEGR